MGLKDIFKLKSRKNADAATQKKKQNQNQSSSTSKVNAAGISGPQTQTDLISSMPATAYAKPGLTPGSNLLPASQSSEDSFQAINSKSTPSSSVSENSNFNSTRITSSGSSVPAPRIRQTPNGVKPRVMSTSTDSRRLSSLPTTFLRQSHQGNGSMRNSSSNSRTLSIAKSTVSSTSTDLSTVSLPDELVPIVTLIHAQQARSYCEMFVQIPSDGFGFASDPSESSIPLTWMVTSAKLSGTELSIWEMDSVTATEKPNFESGGFKPVYLNISDANFLYMNDKPSNSFKLGVQLTNTKNYELKFATEQDLNFFYSCLLLSQFEYRQLQESFTGALFSTKAIKFSDIRTLLAPANKYVKEEWCVFRVPFLNDKWIRCYVVILPSSKKKKPGKIEMYTSSKKNKKDLLATIINAKSCVSVYPENPDFIDNNALIRLEGECYVNEELLEHVLQNNANDVTGTRSRSSSFTLNKKRSNSSLNTANQQDGTPPTSRRNSVTKILGRRNHTRENSLASIDSNHSNGMSNFYLKPNIARTHLCYLIPETHSGVKPSETMIRIMIPTMNAFKLYGRPERFISSRNERNSLLFGLPQLPFTQYLDLDNAFQLVSLNIENSLKEEWNGLDWVQVFKEMVFFKISKGWSGSGSLIDTFKEGLLYTKERDLAYDDYDDKEADYAEIYNPEDDFIAYRHGTMLGRDDSATSSNMNSPRSPADGFFPRSDSDSFNNNLRKEQTSPVSHSPIITSVMGQNVAPAMKSPLSQDNSNGSSSLQDFSGTTNVVVNPVISRPDEYDDANEIFVTPMEESSPFFSSGTDLDFSPPPIENPKSSHTYRTLA